MAQPCQYNHFAHPVNLSTTSVLLFQRLRQVAQPAVTTLDASITHLQGSPLALEQSAGAAVIIPPDLEHATLSKLNQTSTSQRSRPNTIVSAPTSASQLTNFLEVALSKIAERKLPGAIVPMRREKLWLKGHL
jgi:hypothetical protein